MKKGVLLGLVFGILLMSFVSAYYSPNNFSIRDVLDNTAPDTVVLLLSFVILFAIVSYALGKFFKDNRGISTAISFSISFLAIYGLYKADLFTGFSGFFFNIGVSEDVLYGILPLVLIIGIAFLIWRFSVCMVLTILGILIIIIGFTDLIYANAITIFAGVLFLVIGLFFCFRKRRGRGHVANALSGGSNPKRSFFGSRPSRPSRQLRSKGTGFFGRGARKVGGGIKKGAGFFGKGVKGAGNLSKKAFNKQQELAKASGKLGGKAWDKVANWKNARKQAKIDDANRKRENLVMAQGEAAEKAKEAGQKIYQQKQQEKKEILRDNKIREGREAKKRYKEEQSHVRLEKRNQKKMEEERLRVEKLAGKRRINLIRDREKNEKDRLFWQEEYNKLKIKRDKLYSNFMKKYKKGIYAPAKELDVYNQTQDKLTKEMNNIEKELKNLS